MEYLKVSSKSSPASVAGAIAGMVKDGVPVNMQCVGAGAVNQAIKAMDIARGFRERHPAVPLVLMGYANPMLRRGGDWFAREAAAAGVDGVICVDVPPEEDDALGPELRAAGIAPIRLATPTTDAARLPTVLAGADGFL